MTASPLYINGEWITTDNVIPILNPFDSTVVGHHCLADVPMIDRAYESAVSSQEICRKLPLHQIRRILSYAHRFIDAHQADIAQTICLEAAKPIDWSIAEVQRGLITLSDAIAWTFHLHSTHFRADGLSNGDSISSWNRREPLGVVCCITPFNFPLNLVLHKLCPALLGGNSVILKPAPQTPLTAHWIAKAFAGPDLPPGMLAVIPTADASIVAQHNAAQAISFTGSSSVGKRLCHDRPDIPVHIEAGGTAPVIIDHLPEDLHSFCKQLIQSAYGYAGQTCISTQQVWVRQEDVDPLLAILLEELASIQPTPPLKHGGLLSSVISDDAASNIVAQIEALKQNGATVIWGGTRNGNCLTPTLLFRDNADPQHMAHEIFGPVLYISSYTDIHTAYQAANDSPFGLQASLYTTQLKEAHNGIDQLHYGSVLINQMPSFRLDTLPYGGIKQSGNTKEGVYSSYLALTWEKLIVLDPY